MGRITVLKSAPVNATWSESSVNSIATGYRDTDTAIASVSLAPFVIDSVMTLNRVAGTVGTTQATKLVEIGIYDESMNLLATTERREVPEAGAFEFCHPEITLEPGRYFYAVSCNGTTATFGHVNRMGGHTTSAVMPLTATLTSITPAVSYPALTGYASDLSEPTNFLDVSGTGYRVYGNNGSQPWGLNTSNFKICYSTDSGATFIDLMSQPTLTGGAAIYDIIIFATKCYVFASNCSIFESSDLTASATWTDITCPISAGLRRTYATARPYGITIWNDYLLMGEYSLTGFDLQNDLTDPGGPRILKYGPLSGTPAWALSKQFDGGRHIHSLFQDGSSKLWASIGDATYGSDVGVWRMTTIGTDNWTKWTSLASPYTDHYPVDLVEINPGVGCPTGLYCTSDRPGKHLLYAKVTGSAGSFNLSQQLPRKNSISSETVRSMVYDKNGNKNIYYFTAETTDPALFVSPPPYTQSYRLCSVTNLGFMGRSVISGSYLIIFDRRYKVAKFPWQK